MTSPFKFVAIFLAVGGLVLIGSIYGPILNQEIRYQTLFRQSRDQIKESEIIPQSIDFGLVIPKIGVNSQVFAKVDIEKPEEYLPLLKKGVAHGKGSVLPGEDGYVFIFAHSVDSPLKITRYNPEYYLLNKLEPGDKMIIYYQKRRYDYKVIEKRTVPPETMVDYLRSGEERNLVVQTSHPPGIPLNRLLVIAEEVI